MHAFRKIILFYIFAFAAGGVIQPFLTIYLVGIGLTGTQIGILKAWAAFIAIVLTPAIGIVSDRTQRHRLVLGILVFIKGISTALIPLSHAMAWIFPMVSLRIMTAGSSDAIMNQLTLKKLEQQKQQNLGAIRFWGRLSFASTSLLAGFLAKDRSPSVLFPLAGVMGAIAVWFVSAFPDKIVEQNATKAMSGMFSNRSLRLLSLLGIIFLFSLCRAGDQTFNFAYLAKEFDAQNDLIGILGALLGIAPVLSMHITDLCIQSIGAQTSLVLAFGLHAVGWFGFALLPNVFWAFPCILLQGFGQAFFMISMVILLRQISLPHNLATNQMLAQMTIPGFSNMITQPLSGMIFDTFGGRLLFGAYGVVTVLIIGLLVFIRSYSLKHR